MKFDASILIDNWPVLAHGLLITVLVSSLGALFGFVLALPIALMKIARNRVLQFIAAAFVEVIRNLPFLIFVFLVHFGLPFLGMRMPAMVSGIVALSVYGASYYSEAIRASILSVPRGQFESARVMGMSNSQALWEIIAPQMLRSLVPPSTNITLLLLKESSVLSTLTVPEITYAALTIQGQTFSPIEVFVAIGLLYWILTTTVTSSARHYENRTQVRQNGVPRKASIATRYLSLDWTEARA